MWRRVYLSLLLVRLYFALSPSYLHPDENFQGPEVIAGKFLWQVYSFRELCHLFWNTICLVRCFDDAASDV